jgi:hypothetical protein
MLVQPTMLNSCARAATAAEARFRIDAPEPATRATRIIALDEGAEGIVRREGERPWGGAHFLAFRSSTPSSDGSSGDAELVTTDGSPRRLSDELAEADVALLVATSNSAADAADAIGRSCADRRIMTAGIVMPDGDGNADLAIVALRPYAVVLLISPDNADIRELLTALRA